MKATSGVEIAPLMEGATTAPSLVGCCKRGLEVVDKASAGLVILSMSMMVVLVSGQVFCRYFLDMSLDWADEMSRLTFVWSVLLALPHGIKQGVHVGIDILVRRFSEAAQAVIARLMCGLGALLMGVVLTQALYVAVDSWEELMPTVELTISVFYIAVIIATAHALVHLLFLAWQGVDAWGDS